MTRIVGGSAGDSIAAARMRASGNGDAKTGLPFAILNSRAANRRYLMEFQGWKSHYDKYDLVTRELRKPGSSRDYAPATLVLKALVSLFTVTAKGGPLSFKRPKHFTREDRLVTSLCEIAGKVCEFSGRQLSNRVVSQALLLLHQTGLLYKTKGYYGNTRQCRLFIDLKGYELCQRLEQALHGAVRGIGISKRSFELARENEYGFNKIFNAPKRHDRADYINRDVTESIDREEKLTITNQSDNELTISPQDNDSNLIPKGRENETLARRLFFSKERIEIEEGEERGETVEFNLTLQVRKIIEFIQSNAVFTEFTEPNSPHVPLARITAQEMSALIKAVETSGLTLNFLRRYADTIEWETAERIWFMKTSLGFFCDHFFLIKKLFYRMEAAFQLSLYPHATVVDFEDAATSFTHPLFARVHSYNEDPTEYRALMSFNPRTDDGGWTSAEIVYQALTLSNMRPADRDFIISEHKFLARRWFINAPEVFFGLEKRGVQIGKAVGITDHAEVLAILEARYVDMQSFLAHYRDQRLKANQDLCSFEKYQDEE